MYIFFFLFFPSWHMQIVLFSFIIPRKVNVFTNIILHLKYIYTFFNDGFHCVIFSNVLIYFLGFYMWVPYIHISHPHSSLSNSFFCHFIPLQIHGFLFFNCKFMNINEYNLVFLILFRSCQHFTSYTHILGYICLNRKKVQQ